MSSMGNSQDETQRKASQQQNIINSLKCSSNDNIVSPQTQSKLKDFTAAERHRQTSYAGGVHPNFDANQLPLNPDRPLDDIPKPAPRYKKQLQTLLTSSSSDFQDESEHIDTASLTNELSSHHEFTECKFQSASPWALIASSELASHLELLQLGGLIDLPLSFFEPVAQQHPLPDSTLEKRTTQAVIPSQSDSTALLKPLTQISLLDLSDIYHICAQHSTLTRYGFRETEAMEKRAAKPSKSRGNRESIFPSQTSQLPEMLNDIFAPNWEVILYPERFDNGIDSLPTDILACSVAVHVLRQCQTRKTVNRGLTVQQVCQHMRSYVLSQCNVNPQYETYYRQIRLFIGHVIVAAYYLGLQITVSNKSSSSKAPVNRKAVAGKPMNNSNLLNTEAIPIQRQPIYLSISSKSALFVRYPDISSYYINGWS